MNVTTICKICGRDSQFIFRKTILDRYEISYFRCSSCNFVQTEEPYWLSSAYEKPINTTDLGLVSRSLMTAAYTENIIRFFLDPSGKFLDFGAGYGLLVRMMRDAGFDFYRHDKYCQSLVSEELTLDDFQKEQFEMITAFEVFEHLVNPKEQFEKLLSSTQNILISTILLPQHAYEDKEWWYFGVEHGQHVSLFSLRTLKTLADGFGLHLSSNGNNVHLFTQKKINRSLFRLALSRKTAFLQQTFFPRTSLLETDFLRIRKSEMKQRQ